MMGVRGRWRRACTVADDDDSSNSSSSSLLQLPDEILKRITDWLGNPKDRNAVSRACKRLHAIEGPAREAVFISNCYAIQPMKLVSRFPKARSITIKGKPRMEDYSFIPHADAWGAFATPWVEILVTHYKPILHLKMKRMRISDSDIERLISVCGPTLQRLELPKCSGFSTKGLAAIARGCRNLVALNLCEADVQNEGAPLWLTTVANTAMSLQVLDLSLTGLENVEQHAVEALASRCHTLRLCAALRIDFLLPVLKAAQRTVRQLGLGLSAENEEDIDQITEAFGRCMGLESLRPVWDLNERSFNIVIPIAPQIKNLDLTYCVLGQEQLAHLLGSCVNLEILQCTDIIGDRGMREVATRCKRLKRLLCEEYTTGFITQHGLMAVAKQCVNLEKVTYFAADMTNEALEVLATNCPNLYDVRICLVQKYNDSHPVIELEAPTATLNLGVKALLMKCPVLRRLSLGFDKWHRNGRNVVVNDEGMRYIGQYGKSLEIITLDHVNGTSDAGLTAIACGCVKLRKIELRCCPFGDASMKAFATAAPSLKLLWAQGCLVELSGVQALARRPDMIVEVVKQASTEYADWQVVAYSSACPPRTDLPDNIDFVDDAYNAPLSCGASVVGSDVFALEDVDQDFEGPVDVVVALDDVDQDFEDAQNDRQFETSRDCSYTGYL